MPVVSKIELQKSKKRANVYLDGEFGFGVDLETFVRSRLRVGWDLEEEEIDKIKKETELRSVLDWAINYATLRPRSEREIVGWLARKKVDEDLRGKVLEKLTRLELVDDAKFAKWWVEQRTSFRPRSRRELREELKMKGISREIVEEVLSESGVDEEKIAGELLRKNMYRWERFDERTKKRKMGEYLARKGFGWGVVRGVVDKVGKEK